MNFKKLLGVVPTLQSAALVGENIKSIKKKNKTPGHFATLGLKNIVGTKLIQAEANLIGGFK